MQNLQDAIDNGFESSNFIEHLAGGLWQMPKADDVGRRSRNELMANFSRRNVSYPLCSDAAINLVNLSCTDFARRMKEFSQPT